MRKPQRNLEPVRALAYVHLLPTIAEIARACGYAACVHGSMHTDLDILLCPWIEECTDASTVVEAIRQRIGGWSPGGEKEKDIPSERPHGRLSFSYYFTQEEARRQQGAYIDISVMPRIDKRNKRSVS